MTETYILKLAIDDSQIKALEQRLGGIMGVKSGSSSTSGTSGEVVKNITKLGLIATGVGGILGLVKKISEMTISASPMLQAMLKLFNTSVMLILRPIGDFIGFALRPILMYFLLYVALPFYRYFAPFMQKYGNALGQIFASPIAFSGLVAGGVATGLTGLVIAFRAVSKFLQDILNRVFPKISSTPPPSSASGSDTSKPWSSGKPITDPNTGKPINLVDPNVKIGTSDLNKTINWIDQFKSLIDRIKSFATGKVPKQLIDLARKFADLIKALPGGALGLGFPIPPELKALLGLSGGSTTAAAQPTPVPSLTSRFTGNSRINTLSPGFTQGSAAGSIGNPSFTIHINAGTIVDPNGLSDMIKNTAKQYIPSLVQQSIRRTIIR